jgi:enterochelin esterase-like enzyme
MSTSNPNVASANRGREPRPREPVRRESVRRELRHRQVRRRRFVALGVLITLGMLVTTGAVLAASRTGGISAVSALPPTAPRTVSISCPSPALGGSLPALAYLPSGYGNGTHRDPVVYFLHGLPANPDSYQSNGFVAQALAGARRQAIVITPQGVRTPNSDPEYLDSPGKDWPQAISHDLTSCVDHRFRTIARRQGRVLAGLSAGGYGAFNIGMREIATFAALESWSGYFEATDPDGLKVLDFGSDQANASARAPRDPGMRKWLARFPTYLGFYVGTQDARFLQDNRAYDTALTASGIAHVFRTYPGGHTAALWRAEAPSWLAAALDYLAARRSS